MGSLLPESSNQHHHLPTTNPVKIDTGLLSGLTLPNKTRAFLGIPYAKPPLDDLRWRPPQPPDPWTTTGTTGTGTVRSATKFGPASLQFAPPVTSIYSGGETEFSEDCLYLNVYTGEEEGGGEGKEEEEEGKDKGGRPVLVWIHFGAFLFGSASNPLYDGSNLAAKGLTVVTFNHRLGRLGFLSHPDLTVESGYGGSGNYGIMDQIAALQWVQRNVAAFGGDPGNVTIGGASAGGGSTHILRASPLAKNKGLFSKVICESGPGLAPAIEHGPGHVAAYTSLAAAEEAGKELLGHLGAESIAELRKMSAKEIMAVHLLRGKGPWKADIWPGTSGLSMFDTANPNIDGYVLPESPLSALVSGRAVEVPLLCGNVGNETSGLPYLRSLAEYHDFVKKSFGEGQFEEVLDLYPAKTDTEEEVRKASSQILGDQVFIYPSWSAARFGAMNQKDKSKNVWYYMFTRAPPIPADADVIEKERAGAFHVAGIPYGFETLDAWKWDWTDADRVLSKQFSDAWVQFVKTGNPNDGGSNDSWPTLRSSDGKIKVWDLTPRLEPVKPQISKMTALLDKHYGVASQVNF